MTKREGPDKIIAEGQAMLGPIWNAVREFAGIGPGEVVLRFDAAGKLAEIASTKKTKL